MTIIAQHIKETPIYYSLLNTLKKLDETTLANRHRYYVVVSNHTKLQMRQDLVNSIKKYKPVNSIYCFDVMVEDQTPDNNIYIIKKKDYHESKRSQ